MRIQLVLRNPLDTKIAPVPETEMASLFTGEKPAVIAGKPHAVKRKPAATSSLYDSGNQRRAAD